MQDYYLHIHLQALNKCDCGHTTVLRSFINTLKLDRLMDESCVKFQFARCLRGCCSIEQPMTWWQLQASELQSICRHGGWRIYSYATFLTRVVRSAIYSPGRMPPQLAAARGLVWVLHNTQCQHFWNTFEEKCIFEKSYIQAGIDNKYLWDTQPCFTHGVAR